MEKVKRDQFAVIGLGRFGMSIIKTLAEYDVSILACDKDPARLHAASDYATHVVQVDVLDEASIGRLGLGNFDVVIIAMGEDFEASIMTTMLAKEQGAKHVLAKAYGARQKKILESVGADKVVLPEHEMGVKIARRFVDPNILDIFDETEHFIISETRPLKEWLNKSVRQSDIQKKHDLMIIAIRRGGRTIVPVSADQVIMKDDILITLSSGDEQ